MIRMAKAMGVENPTSGKDFIRALDQSDCYCRLR
jgi:alcohol dehydrogenase